MSNGAPNCEHCHRKRCNRWANVPYGPQNLKLSKRVCGWCLSHKSRDIRAWLDKLEAELKAGGKA